MTALIADLYSLSVRLSMSKTGSFNSANSHSAKLCFFLNTPNMLVKYYKYFANMTPAFLFAVVKNAAFSSSLSLNSVLSSVSLSLM